MRKKPRARCHGAEHPPEDARRPAENRPSGVSAERWRVLEECIGEAYAHYERRLVDLRHETVDLLTTLLERRGLSTRSRASARRGVP
jgi:hypothetical protein